MISKGASDVNKSVAVGIQSYSQLISDKCFFIDKTLFIKEFISEVMHQLENRGIGEGTAYIKKDWNTKLSDELSANEKERYLEAINANWKSDFLNFDIKELITEETYKIENDDITSKDSDNIYNKLKLYLDETK